MWASLDHNISWDTLEATVASASVPVLVKGILRGDAAVKALDHGAAGVIVSNHGGRQLDTAVTTARALVEVVEAVNARGEVLVESGIRLGTDVAKALGLGASAVLVGRPALWGLGVGGHKGVTHALNLIVGETPTWISRHDLLLAGCCWVWLLPISVSNRRFLTISKVSPTAHELTLDEGTTAV